VITPNDIDFDLAETIRRQAFSNMPDISLVRAVLAWLANNPILPDADQANHLMNEQARHDSVRSTRDPTYGERRDYASLIVNEWQKIAYLQKEEPIPEEIKSLLFADPDSPLTPHGREVNERIVQAYKFGKESK
jgi:hypothetical protein